MPPKATRTRMSSRAERRIGGLLDSEVLGGVGDDGAHGRFLFQTTGVSKRAAGEMRLEIVANELSHRLAGLDRAARLVRLDDDVARTPSSRLSMFGSFENTSSAAPPIRFLRRARRSAPPRRPPSRARR